MNSVMHNVKPIRRSGQSLVGVLVSVFILIGLAAVFLMPRGNKDGEHKPGALKRSINMAKDVGTTSYIGQIRDGIAMYKSDNDGKPPASLEELKRYLKDYPPEMWVNPVDNKPFLYDPATGTICEQGPGCPPDASSGSPSNPPAPGANPPAPVQPGAATGPGGVRMNIPQPGAGAAEAMNDN